MDIKNPLTITGQLAIKNFFGNSKLIFGNSNNYLKIAGNTSSTDIMNTAWFNNRKIITGTWTPGIAITPAGSSTTFTDNTYRKSSTGSYTKVGKIIILRFEITFAKTGPSGGAMYINGLPYTLKPNCTYPLGDYYTNPNLTPTFVAPGVANASNLGLLIRRSTSFSTTNVVNAQPSMVQNGTVWIGTVIARTE